MTIKNITLVFIGILLGYLFTVVEKSPNNRLEMSELSPDKHNLTATNLDKILIRLDNIQNDIYFLKDISDKNENGLQQHELLALSDDGLEGIINANLSKIVEGINDANVTSNSQLLTEIKITLNDLKDTPRGALANGECILADEDQAKHYDVIMKKINNTDFYNVENLKSYFSDNEFSSLTDLQKQKVMNKIVNMELNGLIPTNLLNGPFE